MTKAEIIQWIKDYKRPKDDVSEFAKQLGEKIKELDFKASNKGAAIGYAGSLDGANAKYTGLYITVGSVSEYSENSYSYINYSAENILNDPEFLKVLVEKVESDNADKIMGGEWSVDADGVWHRSKYSFPDAEILALNDLVSENFMNTNARGDVLLIIAENARADSALTLTELPSLMKNNNVDSILGISKKDLEGLTDVERFELLKAKSLAMQSEAVIYGGLDAEGNYCELMSFEGTSYADKYGISTKMPEGFTRQCTYAERLGESVSLYTTDKIKEKYAFLGDCADTDIVTYKTYEYLLSTGASDDVIRKTGILPDTDIKFKYEFLSDCTDTDTLNQFRNYEYITTNDIAKTTAERMSANSIYLNSEGKLISMSDGVTGEVPTDSIYKITMNDAKNFLSNETMESMYQDYKSLSSLEKIQAKQFDYEKRLISDMVDKGITSEKGIELLPTDELKTKYSFIDDATDANVIKELQLAEYRNSKYGTGVADSVTLYFDDAGKVVAASNQSYKTNIESNIKYTTAIEDYLNASKNFLLDETMESMYKGYKDLSPLEKIQAKQLDYDCRQINLELDKIMIQKIA